MMTDPGVRAGAAVTAASAEGAGAVSLDETWAVETRGVRKAFGGVVALAGVDLQVPTGRITALIGPNGAGKSSFFNVITGHMAPDEGEVRVLGEDIVGRSMWQVARLGVARTFQTPRGFQSMTVLENLLVASTERNESLLGAFARRRRGGRSARERADEVLERIGLADLAHRRYDQLSAGQMHVLEIGRQLMRDVRLLLLDEPTAGVIPSAQDRLGALLVDLVGSGVTVLLVEHNLRFVFSVADHVTVMVGGRTIRHGSPQEIQHDEAVIEAYLGRRGPGDA
jgi:ABC-type branched-subunit amino acid transport system ATPase component